MRTLIIVAGAGLVAASAGAIGGLTVEPTAYPWILWTWLGSLILVTAWAVKVSR